MGRTVAYYNIFGVSKAKTNKAILVAKDGLETWIPLSVAQVKFVGKNYEVKVTVPDWFFRKISWKPLSEFKPKAKPANPYIGADTGNMMEERMVLEEIAESETGEAKQKLLDQINAFFSMINQNGKFDELYNKYYGDVEDFDYVDLEAFHSRVKEHLSRYSPFIKAAADKHGFDWRLIAAQIYQESHLNPWAKSQAGARGLMQILPSTAKDLGIGDLFDPVQNINAGVQHLKDLYDHFDQAHGEDRLLIALAAYNIGQGHINDARDLAKKKGLDPDKWVSLSKTLPLLQYRKYFMNTQYGFCRGTEPIRYIKQILIYYDVLKRQGFKYKTAQA